MESFSKPSKARSATLNLQYATKLLIAVGLVTSLTGCFSNKFTVLYDTEPEGARLYCDGKPMGLTPVKVEYTLTAADKKMGLLYTKPCMVKWISGANAKADIYFHIDNYPNGVVYTIPRPDFPGYTQDFEYAVKVNRSIAKKRAADITQERATDAREYSNFRNRWNTINEQNNNLLNNLNSSDTVELYAPPKADAPAYFHSNGKSWVGSDGTTCTYIGNSVVCR